MAESKIERRTLTVVAVQEVVPIGDKGIQKLPFTAKDETGIERGYFTYRKTFFSAIKKDAVLDCEVETSQREVQGNIYTDRKINQIFVEGEPVKPQGGYQRAGRSPQEIWSIEQQVAVKEVGDWLRAEKPSKPLPQELFDSYVAWLQTRLNTKVPAVVETSPKKEPAAAKPSVMPVIEQPTFDYQAEFTKLQKAMKEEGLDPSQVKLALGINSTKEWFDAGHTGDEAVQIIHEKAKEFK